MKVKGYALAAGAAAFCALLLAIAAFSFRGLAASNAWTELEKTMQTLLPGSAGFTAQPYTGADSTVQAVYQGKGGWVVETACPGYVHEIRLLVGVGEDGTVTGLVVRDAHETLGLGSAILRDHAFLAQFLGTAGRAEIGVDVDAITGATVSSRAVARCVNAAVAAVTGVDAPAQATPWGDDT